MNADTRTPPSPGAETERFRFESRALPEEKLHVIRFRGSEGLNELFSFRIDLVSPNPALPVGRLLGDRAVFRILREDGREAVFCGYPAEARQDGYFNGYSYYTVELRPTFWKMSQIVQSRIFLDQTLQDTVQELLRSQEFFSFPHRLELTRADYPKREFAMQYDESIYDYLCWRLEDQGAYYYFAQSEAEDSVCFADGPVAHQALPDDPVLAYSPVSGLEGEHAREILRSFSLTQSQRPRRVVIRSHSWKNPNKPIVGFADVSPDGLGDVYLADEDVDSDADAARLAKIRAEALRCRERIFSGESSIPGIRPGYTFTLKDHYNPTFNRDYLVTDVTHEGSQESFINLGLGIPLEGVQDHLFYRNSFHCIEAERPFRPERKAPRARIAGVIHAFIDGASEGSRPEIDELGRYKILFPFDVSGRGEGKASCWVRRAQEQVGKNSGMSFPLLNGTEVLVSFVDGNPDRPYITGALANAETGALTGKANANISGFNTAGGNSLVFNDSPQKQGIGLRTASGSGMVFAAGSADVFVAKKSYDGNVAAVASQSFTGAIHNMFSAGTIRQEVGGPGNKFTYIFPILETLGEIIGATGEQLGESLKDEEAGGKANVALGIIKTIFLLIESQCEKKVSKASRKSIYGFTARHGEGDTMTQLKTPFDMAQQLTILFSSGVLAGADTVVEQFKTEDEQKEANEKKPGSYSDTKKKWVNLKQYTQHGVDLLAEIIAFFMLMYRQWGKLKKEEMGGILLHAEDANITLQAEGPIGLHSGQGILLRTGARLLSEMKQLYGEEDTEQNWGSRKIATGRVLKNDLANFYSEAAVKYAVETLDKAKEMNFLADSTDFRYMDAGYLVQNVGEVHKASAQKHIIAAMIGPALEAAKSEQEGIQAARDAKKAEKDRLTGTPGTPPQDLARVVSELLELDTKLLAATKKVTYMTNSNNEFTSAIVVQKASVAVDGKVPQAPSDKGGIFLTTAETEGVIRLDTPETTITLDAGNAKDLNLSQKNGEESCVTLNGDGITLKLAKDGKVCVELKKDKITLKCDEGSVTIEKDLIELDNSASRVNIKNIQFDGSTGAAKGVHNICDGAIKIM